MNARSSVALALGIVSALAVVSLASPASAQLTIKNPKDHTPYFAELDPHIDFLPYGGSYGGGLGRYHGSTLGLGAGFRATLKVAEPVIPKLNNAIGITFGADAANCGYCSKDWSLIVPVGVNWTFFLTKQFSVFGEGGFALRGDGFFNRAYPEGFGAIGGRWHFADKMALTLRVGYPYIAAGIAFFVGG